VIHNDGVVKDANQNMTVMFGYSPSELKGKLLFDLIIPEFRGVVLKNIQSNHEKPFEAIGIRKDGSRIWLELILTSIQGSRDHSSVAAIRDISDRKQTEEKLLTYQARLRSLASELSITEERERRQMAAFLHDSIGQLLAFCKIKLGSLQMSTACEGSENHVQEIRNLVDEAIQNTRSLTLDLSPPILYELGFEAAVKSLAEKMSVQHGLGFIVKTDKALKPLNIENRVLLYSAVKELLTNIIKHAQAHQVIISITKQKDSIKIQISDDGIGFDSSIHTSKGIQGGGFGLFNIRENLFHLGGHMGIHSQLGRGTQVNIIAKLQNNIKSTGTKYERPDNNR
jgi:PAS domain S-box-containing protein